MAVLHFTKRCNCSAEKLTSVMTQLLDAGWGLPLNILNVIYKGSLGVIDIYGNNLPV